MSNPIQHAQHSQQTTAKAVKGYMPGLGKRLVLNYGVLMVLIMVINASILALLLRFLPRSTANSVLFIVTVAWFYYGWRFLETRNRATALFILYTRFSRERRILDSLLNDAQQEKLENMDPLYTQVDRVEEAAQSFISAAEDQQIPRQDS